MDEDVFIQAGDIVFVNFPMHDNSRKKHYGLVLSVEQFGDVDTVTVAYGSSKKVSISGHLPHEFVVHSKVDLMFAGLHKPTRFDLTTRAQFLLCDCTVVGRVRLEDPSIANQIRDAIRYVCY